MKGRKQWMRCVAWLAASAGLSAFGCISSAQAQAAWDAPIAFHAEAQTPYFIVVRARNGDLVNCIASAAGASGQRSVAWDGRDASGHEAPAGTYRVFLRKGIDWKLDPDFGNAGRLGRYVTEQVIQDPEAAIPVPGVLDRMAFGAIINPATADLWPNPAWPVPIWRDRVRVNDKPYARVSEFAGPDTSFVFSNGAITLNPDTTRRGDVLKAVSYDICFLENPWDVAVGDDGSLYVLLRWPSDPGFYGSSLVKLAPDGRKVDTTFGVAGEIPFLFRSSQVILAPEENRLYIAGSHWSS